MNNETWWGRSPLRTQSAAFWQIGPLDLLVERNESDWIVSHRHVARLPAQSSSFQRRSLGSLSEALSIRSGPQPSTSTSPFFSARWVSHSFLSQSPHEDLMFSPIMPDQPFALHFREPICLEPNEKMTLNVRLPMQIQIDVTRPDSAPRNLIDVSLEPLSKTWYGPSPLQGQLALCTFDGPSLQPSRATVLPSFNNLQPRLDQAGAQVLIKNVSTSSTRLERLLIPCGRLSLFHSSLTGFWTDTVVVEIRENAYESAETERTLPREAGQAQFVAHPHQQSAKSRTIESGFNTIAGLFRERG